MSDRFPLLLDYPQRLLRPTLALLLATGVLIVFLSSLGNDFVNYDDPDYITRNAHIQGGFTRENVQWAFETSYASNWHPLTWLSHMVDWKLFGRNARGHHFTSALLHAAAGAILFLAFCEMTGAVMRSFALAALFALHPLRVESVVWACERKDVLALFFGALTLWFYAQWCSRGKRASYIIALATFIVGLLGKSVLVTLPFVLLLLDFWPLRRLHLWSVPSTFGRRISEKLPFFGAALIVGIVTVVVQANSGAVKTVTSYPLPARIGNAIVSYVGYIGKFLCPIDLAAFYPHPVWWPWSAICGAALVLGALTWLVISRRHRQPYLFTGWFWFLITAVPMIGLIQVGAQSMADRYSYLPSIGLTLMAVWGTADLLADWPRAQRYLPLSASILAIVTLAFLTWRQIGVWRNSETLFRHAIAVTGKNPVAHMNLGIALIDRGETAAGLAELRAAVSQAPRYSEAHLTLGTALEKMGDYDGAITELDETIRLSPRSAKAYLEAGVVFHKLGRFQQAGQLFSDAVARDPALAEAHNNLGACLEKLGNTTEAVREYSAALKLDPTYADAHQNLGALLFRTDQPEPAREHFARLVALRPDSPQAHNNLAGALYLLGRADEAIEQYRIALQLDPDYVEAQTNLAGALKNRH